MAQRTTVGEVRNIADFDLTDSEVQAFIDFAEEFIDSRMSDATVAQKERVEPWVAAHLASMRDPSVRIQESRIGAHSVVYEGSYDGIGLESTRYGQTALMLDPTGSLVGRSRFSMAVNTKD